MHLQRLRREVTLLRYLRDALLDNQHFALIQDWQLDEPPYYLARDYTAFGTLSQWRGLADAPVTQRMAMMQGLCDAVAAMHALGVTHRQLHADTILVDSAESGPQLKISAFDLAALNDRSALAPLKITAAGLTVGVGELGAELTSADDVLALGTVLLQLALGDLQAQPSAEWLNKIQNPKLQTLLNSCFGAVSARPSAAELAVQLRNMNAPESTAPAINTPATHAPPETLAPKETPSSTPMPVNMPETIGNYRLLDRLGEGGMGSVYLAEQREPYRQVALKIIRSGLDGQQILSRFEAERQALALMNHPNVTTVLDSGLAADGRPFFAMEYVKGDEITHYCDAHNLNLPARIKLFLQVCDGVLHAHQKGVLHRDIKPSNLMVSGAAESAGTVKIIDFGLAKSLHGKLAAHTLHTSFGAFIGTPIYSSPEHVLGAAAGVDTRSDIYSMGVVLYELLAGRTPIATESLENLEPEKVREIICKSRLPSMREQLQNTSEEKRAAIAEHRAIKLNELPKTLEGDLSWVVGKCLERDPNDRYASVLELRKDLERWLELRPVEARPTSSWYRFAKLVRRNQRASTLIAVSVTVLLGTTTLAVMGFVRAERALAQAKLTAGFQQKQIEKIDLNAMARGLRNDLSQSLKKLGIADTSFKNLFDTEKALASIDFVDLARKRMELNYLQPTLQQAQQDFQSEPELLAGLLQSVAISAREMGAFGIAWQAQQESLTLHTRLFGEQGAESLNALYQRGLYYQAEGKAQLANQDIAIAYAGFAKALGKSHPQTLQVALALVETQIALGDPVELNFVQQAYQDHRTIFGAGDIRTIQARRMLGETLVLARRHQEAELELQAALSATSALDGAKSRTTAQANAALADNYLSQRKFALALPYLEATVSAYAGALGKSHIQTLNASNDLAFGYYYVGRMDDARDLLLETVDALIPAYGSDYFRVADCMYLLAMVDIAEGKVKNALSILQTSYERMLRSGSENEYVYKWLFVGGIAEALTTLGEFDQAEPLILERLAKDNLPSGFIGRLEARRALAMIQIARGRTNEAVANMNKILQALQQHSPDDQSRLDFVRSGLGEALYANGELAQARTLLEAVLARQKSGNSGKPNDVPLTKARLSAVLLAQAQVREAVVLITEAVQAARGFMHPHNPQLAWLLAIESQVLFANGKSKEAIASFKEAAQIIDGSGLGEYYVMQLRPSCEALQRAELLIDFMVDACH